MQWGLRIQSLDPRLHGDDGVWRLGLASGFVIPALSLDLVALVCMCSGDLGIQSLDPRLRGGDGVFEAGFGIRPRHSGPEPGASSFGLHVQWGLRIQSLDPRLRGDDGVFEAGFGTRPRHPCLHGDGVWRLGSASGFVIPALSRDPVTLVCMCSGDLDISVTGPLPARGRCVEAGFGIRLRYPGPEPGASGFGLHVQRGLRIQSLDPRLRGDDGVFGAGFGTRPRHPGPEPGSSDLCKMIPLKPMDSPPAREWRCGPQPHTAMSCWLHTGRFIINAYVL